ncbi:MAG: protein kinase [Bryobacteraceae bacterium]|jgi:serine/threonine protein kinase
MSQRWERFRFVRRLGKGSFGETVLVNDQNDGGRLVVIKIPLDDETERALINELISAAVLHASLKQMYHPNIVRYLGFDKYEEHYVMVMEYVQGSDLRELIRKFHRQRTPEELDRGVRLMVQACTGLVAAHGARLQHNDIKPENILVPSGDVIAKLTDFGISRICKSTSSSGAAGGTYPYMAPEAWHGRSTFQSDIWSLGVTFYEVATGRLPFFADNLGDLKQKIDTDDPIPPRSISPALDPRIEQAILKAMEKNQRRRFASAREMLDALEVDLDRQITQARDLFNQGKPQEAEALLSKLLEAHPCEAKIYLALSDLHNRCLQYTEGEKVLDQGVAKCPQNAQLRFCLAVLLSSQKQWKKAVAALEQAIQLGLSAEQRGRAERLLESWRARGS